MRFWWLKANKSSLKFAIIKTGKERQFSTPVFLATRGVKVGLKFEVGLAKVNVRSCLKTISKKKA
jgi:hypothetical protein